MVRLNLVVFSGEKHQKADAPNEKKQNKNTELKLTEAVYLLMATLYAQISVILHLSGSLFLSHKIKTPKKVEKIYKESESTENKVVKVRLVSKHL